MKNPQRRHSRKKTKHQTTLGAGKKKSGEKSRRIYRGLTTKKNQAPSSHFTAKATTARENWSSCEEEEENRFSRQNGWEGVMQNFPAPNAGKEPL